MTFLKDLVNGDERFECLDLIGEDWLAGMGCRLAMSYT